MTKECDILHDVISVVTEICILVKVSPKREHLLGNIRANIEKVDSESFKKLKKTFGNEMESLCRIYEKSH